VPASISAVCRGLTPLLFAACAASTVDVGGPGLPTEQRPYLLSPLDGWMQPLESGTRSMLQNGFDQLQQGEPSGAMARAAGLLDASPGLKPASLLAAQAEFVAGRNAAALDRLSSWVESEPAYKSATLLWARLAQLGDDPITAYAAYKSLDATMPIAARGAAATYEKAMQALDRRLQMDLSAGRLAAAKESLEQMRSWGPVDSVRTLEAERLLGAASGDARSELEALRALVELGHNRGELVERMADLELRVGDLERGMQLLEGLLARDPEDRALEHKLTKAELLWRLRLLPEDVQALVELQELSRSDYAMMLYWLVPGLRQARAGSARIATDILDHEHRQEIVRVLNRGLMTMDSTLHRFEPDQPVLRSAALRSLLEMVRERGAAGECAQYLGFNPEPSPSFLCELAHQCGILDDISACLPGATLSGAEAVELVARSLSISQRE